MESGTVARPGERLPRLRRLARRFLAQPRVNSGVFLLVLISVVLLFVELSQPEHSAFRHELELANEAINVVFVLELILRWLAATSFRSFLREHWIDILAVLPLLRVFRLGRAFRLVRLLRLIALGVMLNRRMRLVSSMLRAGGVEFVILGGVLVLAIGFGTIGIATYEKHVSIAGGTLLPMDIPHAFWTTIFSMFSAQYHMEYPESIGGRIVVIILIFFGVGITAMVTGTVAALMVGKMKEGAGMKVASFEDYEGHVLVCGWNSHAPRVLEVLHAEPQVQVVVVAELQELPDLTHRKVDSMRVSLLPEDFAKVEALKRANVEKARAAIILSDMSKGRTIQDADARTVLTALTIEKIASQVRTSAELFEQSHESHLRMAGVEDVVISGEYSGSMLAHSALERGILDVIQTMLRGGDDARLMRVPADPNVVGKSFEEALPILKKSRDAILLAVDRKEGGLHVNPYQFTLQEGDMLVLLGPKRNS